MSYVVAGAALMLAWYALAQAKAARRGVRHLNTDFRALRCSCLEMGLAMPRRDPARAEPSDQTVRRT